MLLIYCSTMTKLLVEVDDDMLETVRVMLGVQTKKDTVNGALALIIAGQDERVRLGIEALATHNDEFPPHDRSEAW
jgi:Arc/MetJ family transcription regulator